MEKNYTGIKFKDLNTTTNKKLKKEFYLKKINLEHFPKMKKDLDIFFNDSKKYFDTSYEDKIIIIGKKSNKKNNKRIRSSLRDSTNSKIKSKNTNFFRRVSIYKSNILKASNDSSNKSNNIRNSKMITEEKKKVFMNLEENSLKPGQRFVDDKEIENLFNLFKEVRRINKNKIKNFVTVSELNENKNKNLKFLKSSKNLAISNLMNLKKLTSNNIMNLRKQSSKTLFNSFENNKKKQKKYNNLLLSKKKNLHLDNNPTDEKDFYRTVSTGFSGNFKDECSFKSNNLNNDENKNNRLKSSEKKIIKERKKMIKRQNQYLENEIDNVINNKLKDILALQERTFMVQSRNKVCQSKLNKYLSSKIKRPNKRHLLLEDEYYRPNLEMKIKLSNYHKKLYPEEIYDWYKDLHSSGKFLLTDESLPIVEIIRNPKTMKNSTPIRNKILENNYLKGIIPKKSLKQFSKDYKNIQNNFNSLSVNGVNLLTFENDLFKKLKGRKIINDFERLMSPSSIKCKDIYSNIDKNIFNQKKKTSFQLFD